MSIDFYSKIEYNGFGKKMLGTKDDAAYYKRSLRTDL